MGEGRGASLSIFMVKIPSNADSMHYLMPKGKNLGHKHACLGADQEVMKGSTTNKKFSHEGRS